MFKPRLLLIPDADGTAGGTAANADAGNVAAPEGIATPTEPTPAPAPSPTEPAAPAKPDDAQEQKITKVVSERIKKEQERIAAEAKAAERQAAEQEFDSDIASLGLEWNGKPITTRAELKQAQTERQMQEEAAKNNIPVELYSRLTQAEKDALEAKTRLSQYERKEALTKEAETLAADPVWGDFYKAHEQEIRETADKHNLDLGTAKLLVLDKLGLPKFDEKAIGDKAIQEFIEKKRTIQPVEGSGATPVVVPSSPKTWDEAREGAKAMMRAQKG